MGKYVFLTALLIICGGMWLYLDYLNKQEQLSAKQMRMSLEQAKARAATTH